jgi:hypothetical protein
MITGPAWWFERVATQVKDAGNARLPPDQGATTLPARSIGQERIVGATVRPPIMMASFW